MGRALEPPERSGGEAAPTNDAADPPSDLKKPARLYKRPMAYFVNGD
jgi:hypothetical protein